MKIQTLLENTRIFLVPAIDIDGFDAAIPGIFINFSFFLASTSHLVYSFLFIFLYVKGIVPAEAYLAPVI